MAVPNQHTNIFIAYAKADENILELLRKHLTSLERTEGVTIWYNGKIDLGKEWLEETEKAMANANIILLLVSADFIASDFCYEHQMKQALELHAADKASVIPVIIRDCAWENAPFSQLKVLPLNGVHSTSSVWDTEDEPYVEIARALNEHINPKTDTEPKSKTRKRGRVLYHIPAKMQKGVTSLCTIRIAPEDIPESILKEALETDKTVIENIRRIGKYMKVQLVNDSNDDAFIIKEKSTEEQVIEDDDYSEWLYDVTPRIEGVHSLQLKVSVTLVRDEHGKEYKDVVVLDRVVVITTDAVYENFDWVKAPADNALILVHPEEKEEIEVEEIEEDEVATLEKALKSPEDTNRNIPKPATPPSPLPSLRRYGRALSIGLLLVFFIPAITWAVAPGVFTPIILSTRYDENRKLSDDRIAVKKDGKWGIVNKWGIESVAPEYDEIKDYENEITEVKKDGKWGALKQADKEEGRLEQMFSPKDKLIVPVKADAIETISEDEVEVRMGNKRMKLPTLSKKKIKKNKTPIPQEEREIDSLFESKQVEKVREKLLKLPSNSKAKAQVEKQVERQKTKWADKYTEEVYEAAEAGDSAKVEGLKKDIQRVKSIKPEKKPKEKNKNNKKQNLKSKSGKSFKKKK